MATIGEKTLQKATDLLGGLLFDYQGEIDEAYTKMPGKFHVALGLDFEPGQSAEFKISGTIDFIAERIKDKAITMSDERQMPLFNNTPPLIKQVEWKDTGITGVTCIEITERHLEMEQIEKWGYCSSACPFHKGMSNAMKGYKIKGAYGKCISASGACENPVVADHLAKQKSRKPKDLF